MYDDMEMADPNVCCFCGKTLNKYDSNNPDPACTIEGARCCGECDMKIVIPARISIGSLIKAAQRNAG